MRGAWQGDGYVHAVSGDRVRCDWLGLVGRDDAVEGQGYDVQRCRVAPELGGVGRVSGCCGTLCLDDVVRRRCKEPRGGLVCRGVFMRCDNDGVRG